MTDLDLSPLTGGQRRVVEALLDAGRGVPTYKGVAEKLGVALGSVYTHLKRVRDNYPDLYDVVMLERKKQLAKRHQQALSRAERHSRQYFRRKWNREFQEKHGYYPWEAWLYRQGGGLRKGR
jgi:transposase